MKALSLWQPWARASLIDDAPNGVPNCLQPADRGPKPRGEELRSGTSP